MNLVDSIVAQAPELTAIRRDIHAHPELSFKETRTADVIAGKLESWGIPVHRGLGGTGVVGIIRDGDATRTIGLRADMDALPMPEANRFAHASTNPGVMHACGHDGHVTMLLGAARELAQSRRFDGTVYAIFQPAEEHGAGARAMMQDGLFDRFPMEAVFGMHNLPGIPTGHFAASPGPVLASTNEFRVLVHGKGGHGAMPQQAVDPVIIATYMVQAFQTIVSRNKPPSETAVLSVTMIHAGDVSNVIPDTCELRGTVRAYTEATLDLVERRMGEIAGHVAATWGGHCDFTFTRLYPATVNHGPETAFWREVLTDVAGADRVHEQTPIMAAEDFSFMLQQVPGSYCFIGNGDGGHREAGHGDGPCMVHNTSYDFNDALLPVGASAFVRLAERWLARTP